MKNKKSILVLIASIVFSWFGGLPIALAASSGDVVINEMAWAGSADSSNDEWIELFNNTSGNIDLTGWQLFDDGAEVVTFDGVTIPAYGYLLIEDSEAVTSVPGDVITGLSLANSGDALELRDASGVVIDTVNGSGGAWYAGSSTGNVSMERIDAASGDIASNFADSTGSGATASAGSAIIGTPRALNSVSTAPTASVRVLMETVDLTPAVGDIVEISVRAENLEEAYSYGYEIIYDPAILSFSDVIQGDFLSEAGLTATSFHYGLKSGVAGNLLIAEARTIDPKVGISGDGELFLVRFEVIAGDGQTTPVNFAATSFISSLAGDLGVSQEGLSLDIGGVAVVDPVSGLVAGEGTERYQIELNWNGSAESYRVERQDAHGIYQELGTVTEKTFIDMDGVAHGGNIIPNYNYQYRVIALQGGEESVPVEISGIETRGIKGDNNRSDLVDGRDLERLALHFAEDDTDAGFEPLVDTTYDSRIDGSDLIDLGASFAQSY